MKLKLLIIFLIDLLFIFTGHANDDEFVPSTDWKTIKEGQKVPPGLHYRINIQTGEKEAKLLSEDDENKATTTSLSISPDSNVAESDIEAEMNARAKLNIKEALKNIPSNNLVYSEDEIKEIKSKFRSYKEIKSDMKELKMNVKTDSEIIDDLFKQYDAQQVTEHKTKETDLTERFLILEDLEYLVHQIDNANKFIESKGVEKIIIPNLVNQTNKELRIRSLHVLGALMQNNPKAKVSLFEKNLGDHLTKLLASTKQNDELTAIVYAYGSMLRRFPYAQIEILSKSGMSTLLNLIKDEDYETKLKLKIILMLSDFLNESNDFKTNKENHELTPIEGLLNKHKYCEIVNKFIISKKSDILSDLDFADKLIQSCLVSKNLCYFHWSESPMLRHILLILKFRFDEMRDAGKYETVLAYEDLVQNVEKLFDILDFKEMEPKIEL